MPEPAIIRTPHQFKRILGFSEQILFINHSYEIFQVPCNLMESLPPVLFLSDNDRFTIGGNRTGMIAENFKITSSYFYTMFHTMRQYSFIFGDIEQKKKICEITNIAINGWPEFWFDEFYIYIQQFGKIARLNIEDILRLYHNNSENTVQIDIAEPGFFNNGMYDWCIIWDLRNTVIENGNLVKPRYRSIQYFHRWNGKLFGFFSTDLGTKVFELPDNLQENTDFKTWVINHKYFQNRYSTHDNLVAGICNKEHIIVWNLDTNTQFKTFPIDFKPEYVQFYGDLLITAADDRVRLFNILTDENVLDFRHESLTVYSMQAYQDKLYVSARNTDDSSDPPCELLVFDLEEITHLKKIV